MKKFELTAETNVLLGRTLYRIRALRAFGDVDKGELGGFIEKETNLAHEGNAWVSGNAIVSGNARVSGNAWVYNNAIVSGNAEIKQSSHYLVIGPIGSRDDLTTFFRSKALEIMVSCGCFFGTIKKFEEAVNKTHGDNQHGRVYRLAIEMARAQIDLTGEDETKSVEVDDG